MRYPPEEAEKITGVPAEDIRATAREYASRAPRGDLLHPRDHRARVRRGQHLVALEPRAHDRPPRLRVDGAQRAPRPEQRPGAERLGREPLVPPRLPAGRRSRRSGGSSRRRGASRCPTRPGYRLDQIVSGLHDGRIKALYLIGENPAQTEPNARHVEEGLEGLDFLMSQDIFLNDSTRKYAACRAARLELRGEGRHLHEHRAAGQPRARGGAAPGRGEGRPRDRDPHGEGARRRLAGLPGRGVCLERARRPLAELVRHPLRPARGERDAVAVHGPRPSRDAVPARAAAGARPRDADASSRSSSSRRSRSPTPSTRSCSRPAARSTTTTRRT